MIEYNKKNQSKEKYKSMNRHKIPFHLHHPDFSGLVIFISLPKGRFFLFISQPQTNMLDSFRVCVTITTLRIKVAITIFKLDEKFCFTMWTSFFTGENTTVISRL